MPSGTARAAAVWPRTFLAEPPGLVFWGAPWAALAVQVGTVLQSFTPRRGR
jgi:hypothetical protein